MIRLRVKTAFNNTKQTARFILNGEIIDLKQDPMASGIKYSNSAYEYGEHQGEMALKRMEKPFLATNDKTKNKNYTNYWSYRGLSAILN